PSAVAPSAVALEPCPTAVELFPATLTPAPTAVELSEGLFPVVEFAPSIVVFDPFRRVPPPIVVELLYPPFMKAPSPIATDFGPWAPLPRPIATWPELAKSVNESV